MKYKSFTIEKYRAISKGLTIDLSSRIIPLVGVNECGKTTILQAMFCFDYINDNNNDGQHLKNINNLYSTVSKGDCIISATILCTREEVNKCVQHAARKKAEERLKTAPRGPAADTTLMDSFAEGKDRISELKISRNLTNEGRYYSCSVFKEFSADDEDLICRTIIDAMPYILYNDDFNDRPVSEIPLNSSESNEWYDIFERVFKSTNDNYSLKSIAEIDDRVRKSIVSEVETYLSNTLTEAWSKFSPVKKDISISLDIKPEKNVLLVYVKEQINGRSSQFFTVSDRSKGFIWYYNFIMKIRFNPKQTGAENETIFLLDEPGSYLHETAQADLCKKLKDISKKEGIVIYCTHSPQLISPMHIPLNNILIVEKSKSSKQSSSTYIAVESVATKNHTQSVRNTAMQPIYEALQIPEFQTILSSEKILCVEGIYDKYCIESFCNLPENVRIFPSVSADAIINNIQYFIAYQKEYLALWDNDKEGKAALGKAKNKFGEKEACNFVLLPNLHEKAKVRMEEMIEAADYSTLKTMLKLPGDSTYESIISELYFTKPKERENVIKKLSDETKKNFLVLSNLVRKHFGDLV